MLSAKHDYGTKNKEINMEIKISRNTSNIEISLTPSLKNRKIIL